MREFSIAGPVVPDDHYCLPPLERLDLEEVLGHIRGSRYFLLHAPRQSGKTSALIALRDLLHSGRVGEFRAVHANFEVGQEAREDTGRAMRSILRRLADRALLQGDSFVAEIWRETLDDAGPGAALAAVLTRWSLADRRPLVLLVDEIDALVGDTLISVLRQLREGYELRPRAFPQSVALCGLRDVEHYRTEWEEKAGLAAGSPFNIIARSMRLGDFSRDEIAALLGQHTAETGQQILPEAVELAGEETRGQPWLVNALAQQACFEDEAGRRRERPITAADILRARGAVIRRRGVHFDNLARRLREPRVNRVILPLTRKGEAGSYRMPDIRYLRDLGLIASDDPVRIANPIYAEVLPPELLAIVQEDMPFQPRSYIGAEGELLTGRLLGDFQQWFRENSGHWSQLFEFREAGAQLLLQAFCEKIVNRKGRVRVEREAAIGAGRADLLIVWPRGGSEQRFVVELKVRYGSLDQTIREGTAQTARYMDGLGADEGHLLIFDRSRTKPWEQKVFRREEEIGGRTITVWGM